MPPGRLLLAGVALLLLGGAAVFASVWEGSGCEDVGMQVRAADAPSGPVAVLDEAALRGLPSSVRAVFEEAFATGRAMADVPETDWRAARRTLDGLAGGRAEFVEWQGRSYEHFASVC